MTPETKQSLFVVAVLAVALVLVKARGRLRRRAERAALQRAADLRAATIARHCQTVHGHLPDRNWTDA